VQRRRLHISVDCFPVRIVLCDTRQDSLTRISQLYSDMRSIDANSNYTVIQKKHNFTRVNFDLDRKKGELKFKISSKLWYFDDDVLSPPIDPF